MPFNATAMKKLVKNDLYLSKTFVDLMQRNSHLNPDEVLEIVFNSNVLEDSVLMNEYEKLI